MIEPLRPHVDRWVWRLFRKRLLDASNFSQTEKSCLLNKSGRQTFFGCYEMRATTWRRYLRIRSHQIARALLDIAPALPELENP